MISALLTSFSLLGLLAIVIDARRCTILPSDPQWPSQQEWDAFNTSVQGRLIKTVPLANVCHGDQMNPDECINVQQSWHTPNFHEASSSSIMSAPFSNRSCDPFVEHDDCTIGTYVEYTVNVSTPVHIVQTLAFTKKHNIRFVVRNTGHDYMGKSTGHGGLAVWLHHLTDTQWTDSYTSHTYSGPAVRMGAGVSVLQMYTEASAQGYAIIGGDCPSVGMAGGFIQGGGVGPLSTIRGMLADQALAYEVITTTGQLVNATPTENEDLFWALSGGGPGTYGVIWSTTVKVQPDIPMGTAVLNFSVAHNVTLDMWWQGIRAYRSMTFNLTAAGGYALAIYTSGSFQLTPLFLPNGSVDQVSSIIKPFLSELESVGIPYNLSITQFPGFLEAHTTLLPETSSLFDVQNTIMGSRLLQRSLWSSPSKMDALNRVVQGIVDMGAIAYDISVNPSLEAAGNPNNAVFPQWRTANTELALLIPWNDTGSFSQYKQQQDMMTNVFMPAMKHVTPDAGAFLNEADAFDPDWKEDFYGSNYNRLFEIKQKWDPDHLLYGSTAVGGDHWVVQEDGRLCQAELL